jgi:hypothetical protein
MENTSKKLSLENLIIAFFLIIFSSCDTQTDYNFKTNFIYKNLTSETIDIILYDKDGGSFNNYLIEPNKEISVLINSDGPKTGIGQPFRMRNDSRYIATKVILKFTLSNKCLNHLEGTGVLNVRAYDNFSESMYNTSNNTLIYNIDSEELDLAKPCQ